MTSQMRCFLGLLLVCCSHCCLQFLAPTAVHAQSVDLVAVLEGAMCDASTGDESQSRLGMGMLGRRLLATIKKSFAPTAREREAITKMIALLAPDKLGGEDETLNQNDIERIADALLDDPAVQAMIASDIRHQVAKSVDNAPWGLGWLYRWFARQRMTPGTSSHAHWWPQYWERGTQAARQRIRGELERALAAEGIAARRGGRHCIRRRRLRRRDVDAFVEATSVLKGYSERMARRLGYRYRLPYGPSRLDLEAILAMRTPPNGVKEVAAH